MSFICNFMCMYVWCVHVVCICVCLYMRACRHISLHVWGHPRTTPDVIPHLPHCLRRAPFVTVCRASQAVWPASSQVFSCLYQPAHSGTAGITGKSYCVQLCVRLRIWIQVFMVVWRVLHPPSLLPRPCECSTLNWAWIITSQNRIISSQQNDIKCSVHP